MKLLRARKHISFFIISVVLLVIIQACGDDEGPTGPDYSDVPPPFDTTQAVEKTYRPDGLKLYVIEEGNNIFEVVERDQITIYYTGRKTDGTIFASSYEGSGSNVSVFSNLTPGTITAPSGAPISPLIQGFREGLLGMSEGEKRTIVIPPSLGYGEAREGTNGFDLRNDTLIYDVELAGIID